VRWRRFSLLSEVSSRARRPPSRECRRNRCITLVSKSPTSSQHVSRKSSFAEGPHCGEICYARNSNFPMASIRSFEESRRDPLRLSRINLILRCPKNVSVQTIWSRPNTRNGAGNPKSGVRYAGVRLLQTGRIFKIAGAADLAMVRIDNSTLRIVGGKSIAVSAINGTQPYNVLAAQIGNRSEHRRLAARSNTDFSRQVHCNVLRPLAPCGTAMTGYLQASKHD
jgi:hypothetical protein